MILGVTGGIGTGKTTAAQVLARNGVRVIDCDEIARYLTVYDPTVLDAIAAHFGTKVFFAGGALNRAALAEVVFQDGLERHALEQVLHPPIMAVVRSSCAAARAAGYPAVVVAPLLIEAGMAGDVDRVWVVSCSEQVQIERLLKYRGISETEARQRIGAQMKLAEKEQYADLVIRNDNSVEEFEAAVQRAWEAFVATPD
jgi:dephospho-CoA kinase